MGNQIAEKYKFETRDVDRIIEMAWEDRTPFDAIEAQFGIPEKEVIVLMRQNLSAKGWKRWRKHVQGRSTKHKAKRGFEQGRHRSQAHRNITLNKISKRK